jgi:hypothetical protein
MPPHSSHIL